MKTLPLAWLTSVLLLVVGDLPGALQAALNGGGAAQGVGEVAGREAQQVIGGWPAGKQEP